MAEPTLITDSSQATPSWLTAVLPKAIELNGAEVSSVHVTSRRETGYHVIVWLTVDYSRPVDAPARLVLKYSQPTRKTNVPETGREVLFYNEIARHMTHGPAVRAFDAAYSASRGLVHVLMEDLSASHYEQRPTHLPPTIPECRGIVDALARLHAFWWDKPPFELAGAQVVDAAEISLRVSENTERINAFADMLGDRLSDRRRQIIGAVLGAMPRLFTRLESPAGMSVVHSDVHIGNFLYPRDATAQTVRIIDWQTWNVDLAVRDLAHMMAFFWFPEHRGQHELPLLRFYHERLIAYGVPDYTWEMLFDDYRLSVIRLIFHPAWQWQNGEDVSKVWFHFERIMLAYQDLHCAELVDRA
jgi:thiamine kinase-like enzyme